MTLPALLSTMRIVTQQRTELELRIRRISDRIECERVWNTPGVQMPFHICRWSAWRDGKPGWRVGSGHLLVSPGRVSHPRGKPGAQRVKMTGIRCRNSREYITHLTKVEGFNDERIARMTNRPVEVIRQYLERAKEPIL